MVNSGAGGGAPSRSPRSPTDSGTRDPGQLVGASFGQYRIVALLGAGSMGEVWRAHDTRLGREVALKMLPEDVAEDPERMARFTREAKLLASLNHSNIATLFGLEHLPQTAPAPESGSTPPQADAADQITGAPVNLLVMELVEGEGLDETIARAPLPFDEAVAIALQVAEGLREAHERGIVHRDLKPANIRVRPDGTVKVLDFGLATNWIAGRPDTSQSLSPTMTHHRTEVGVVLGTAAYMSPEQARGRPVDRRTDIWAFGCVLYEMLTGSKAFQGDTLSDTMAAVLKDDPNWDALPAGLSPVAQHVLRRCLAKDPDRRFHDVADVRIELEEALVTKPPRQAPRQRRMAPALWLVAAAAVVVATALVIATRTLSADLPTYRALTFGSGRAAGARFAPDGETVVFAMSTREHPLALMSTRTDSVESRPLDLPAADILGISHNGRMAILLGRHCEGSWISVGTLAMAELAGGAPRPILERVNDGDISPDGSQMAVVREIGPSQRLEYPIGRPLFETRGWISNVRISPDGLRVGFLHHPHYGDDRGLVAMVDADGTLTELTEDAPDSLQGLAWSPDGRSIWFSAFVFGQGGVVWSVEPGARPVARLRSPVSLRLQDLGRDGRALVVAGDTRAEIAGLLAGQTEEQRFEGWNDDSIGAIAADGSLFAGNMQVATVGGEYSAFLRRADGSPPVRVGYGDVFGVSGDARWVFARNMTRDRNKLIFLPTGPGEPRTFNLGDIRPDDSSTSLLTCSRDGRHAAFVGVTGDGGPQVYIIDLENGDLRPVGPEGATAPTISPDGTRVAAMSPDGRVIVYSDAGGEPLIVPGVQPRERPVQWSRDGGSILVWDRSFPARIQRVSLADGSREPILEIMPENPAGVLYGQILLAPGGDRYVYRYRRDISSLFLVEGIH